MAQIVLFGGEQDGLTLPLPKEGRPKICYAAPLTDVMKINEARGKAKDTIRDQLSVLAYKFDGCVTKEGTGIEYRYTRAPELDKAPTGSDSAAT